MVVCESVERRARLDGPWRGWFPVVRESLDVSGSSEIATDVSQYRLTARYGDFRIGGEAVLCVPGESLSGENSILEGFDSLQEKILYGASISECPVMNGMKTERIGSYGRILMSKDDMKALSSEQFFPYVLNVVCPLRGEYNWFTIKLDDGTGMVFPVCSLSFDYGELDKYGGIETRLGSGFMNESADGFDYFTVAEEEAMD